MGQKLVAGPEFLLEELGGLVGLGLGLGLGQVQGRDGLDLDLSDLGENDALELGQYRH